MKNCPQYTQVARLDSHIPSCRHIFTTLGLRGTVHTNNYCSALFTIGSLSKDNVYHSANVI